VKRKRLSLPGLCGALAWLAASGMAAGPAAPPNPVVAIRGGTVLTMAGGTITGGTVLIRDGKIAAIGTAVQIPPDAEIVDATGKFVTPGIIDAHSHIAADSINEMGTTVSSMTASRDILNPTDPDIYRDLAGGVTAANVLHGSANPIGGTNVVIKLRWGKTRPDDLVFDGAVPGLKLALGENPKSFGAGRMPGPRRYPATRQGVEFVIRDAFTRAKAYQQTWTDYRKRRSAGEEVVEPRRDLQLEPIAEVLEGKRLVHAHAYRADEMLMLMRLGDELGFKVDSFEHTLEGYKVAPELAAHGAAAQSFADWWGYKEEVIDAIPYNPAMMVRKGVLVTLGSDSAEHARRLNLEAAKTIKWGGLSEDEALRLVTINPAKSLHIEKRVGSIEVGKDADLVIWTKHPLSVYTTVERTYVDGIAYYDRKQDEQRVADVAREKATLMAAEKAAAEAEKAKASDAAEKAPASAPTGKPAKAQAKAPAQPAKPQPAAPAEAAGGLLPALPLAKVAPAPQTGAVIAIVNARLHPVTSPDIERGTILIRGNRIAAVGRDVQVPAGAQIVDAKGGDIYPGWITAASSLGIAEPGPGGWYNDSNEMLTFNPQLRTRVAYKADSDAIPVARSNGLTAAGIIPDGGQIGGNVPVMNLDGWTWDEATVRPSVGLAMSFPNLESGFGNEDGPAEPGAKPEKTYDDLKKARDKKLDDIVALFDKARAYAKAGPDRTIDWSLDALGPIVSGQQALFLSAWSKEDIRDAVAFAERLKVRLVLIAGPDAAQVAPMLAQKKVPVVLIGLLSTPGYEDMFHAANYQAAAELARAGVAFALATGSTTDERLLPYYAAMAVAWGLNREEAIKAMTVRPAEILGVSDLMGSLEPGKLANLFIASGDPLEIRTAVTHVFINGRDVGVGNRQHDLYEKWMARQ
jgi:imidazolonepropionase-like amidohydrolase